MAIKMELRTETYADTEEYQGFRELQSILAEQGYSLSYEETAEIGVELIEFLKALGEANDDAMGTGS